MENKKESTRTYKGAFNVRLSPELHQKAATVASRKDITLNDFVRKAILFALENEQISCFKLPPVVGNELVTICDQFKKE